MDGANTGGFYHRNRFDKCSSIPPRPVIKLPDLGSESNATPHKPDGSSNSSPAKRKRSGRSGHVPATVGGAQSSSRSSLQMFPMIAALADNTHTADIEYGALPDSASIASFGSSVTSLDKVWQPAANQNDDLYSWMAKAHHATKKASAKSKESVKRPPSPPLRAAVGGAASINGIMQDSVRLLDAHLIFEPILTCLGVMPQQMVNNISNSGEWNGVARWWFGTL